MVKSKLELGKEYSIGLERCLKMDDYNRIIYTGMLNNNFFSVLRHRNFSDYILNCPVEDNIEFGKYQFKIVSVKPKEIILKYLGKE